MEINSVISSLHWPLSDTMRDFLTDAIHLNTMHVSVTPNRPTYSDNVDPDLLFSNPWDAVAYSTGFQEKSLPEILCYCGPSPNEEAFTREQLHASNGNGYSLIQSLRDRWNPLLKEPGLRIMSPNGDIFMTVANDPENDHLIKTKIMRWTTEYYNSTDYIFLTLVRTGINVKK